MNTTLTMVKKSDNRVAIISTSTGQTIKTLTVDGTIIGGPNVSGDVGTVQVKKGNIVKMYIYDLKNGTVKKIFTV